MREGERDARSGRRPDYRNQDEFRRGSNGYGWGSGNSSGSNAISSGAALPRATSPATTDTVAVSGYGNQGYPERRVPPAGDVRLSRRRLRIPEWQLRVPGGYGSRRRPSVASRTATATARNDARDNDRYEPTRKKKYREGDDGYNSRYGSRDQYRNEYRQAFQQGYDRGYREGRYR